MPEEVGVDLDLLEATFSLLLARLREGGRSKFLLDVDYFWSIPPDALFEVESRPTSLTIGQVSECLEWLGELPSDLNRALPYHLVWLGEVLRAIGMRAQPDFRGPSRDSA